MNLKPGLSEDELKALLGSGQQSNGAGADAGVGAEVGAGAGTSEGAQLRLHADGAQQDSELLQALKEVVKTLTVRVASLEGEVGRLRAELAASRVALPPAGPRIVVEGVALPTLQGGYEAAAAAAERHEPAGASGQAAGRQLAGPAAAERLAQAAGEALHAGTAEAAASAAAAGGAAPAGPDGAPAAGEAGASLAAQGLSRALRHRKPKKKGLFARWFD